MVRSMYNELFNRTRKKSFRKQLRNEATKAEMILWQQLKGSQLGHKFRRQQGIGPYVVDFYCPELKLVVEVDGGTHFEPSEINRDNQRTLFLIHNKIQVLRVTNTEVYESLDTVIELIKQQFPNDHNHP